MSEDSSKIVKVKGIAMYPKFFQPDTKYDDKWTVDVLLNAEGLAHAKQHNLRIKNNKDSYKDLYDGYDGSYVRIERSVRAGDGSTRERPEVKVYNKGMKAPQDVPSSTNIGSGTEVIVFALVKTMDRNGGEMTPAQAQSAFGGYGLFLTKVQIVNLVEFERSDDPDTDFVQEDGDFTLEGDSSFDFEKGDDLPFDDSSTIIAAG